MKTIIAGFIYIFLLIAGEAVSADQINPVAQMNRDEEQAIFIRYDDGRLQVRLWDAPLNRVLNEIEHRTGIEVVILCQTGQKISMEFENLSMVDGLRRILKGYGWSFVTAGEDNNALQKIFVVSRSNKTHPGRPFIAPQLQKEKTVQRLSAVERAQAVADVMAKEQIKRYMEELLKNPTTVPDLDAFTEVINAVSAEELEPVIQMLEDEKVDPSEWKAALTPLADSMGPIAQGAAIGYLQNQDIRDSVAHQLKAIHDFKSGQKK